MIAVAARLPTVDLSSAEDSAETLLAAFDHLLPGESLLLVTAREPHSLYDRLDEDRHALFEWVPLDRSPARWRTEVTRRSLDAPSATSLHGRLLADHTHFRALEIAALRARDGGEFARAERLIHDLLHLFERHVGFEELEVFPRLEARLGDPATAHLLESLRHEHREARTLLRALASALGDPAGEPGPLRLQLHALWSAHEEREDASIYANLEDLLEESDIAELTKRL